MLAEKTDYNPFFPKMVYLYKSSTNGPQIAAVEQERLFYGKPFFQAIDEVIEGFFHRNITFGI